VPRRNSPGLLHEKVTFSPRGAAVLRPLLPKPGQRHRQITTRDRRIQTPTTPWIVMSP